MDLRQKFSRKFPRIRKTEVLISSSAEDEVADGEEKAEQEAELSDSPGTGNTQEQTPETERPADESAPVAGQADGEPRSTEAETPEPPESGQSGEEPAEEEDASSGEAEKSAEEEPSEMESEGDEPEDSPEAADDPEGVESETAPDPEEESPGGPEVLEDGFLTIEDLTPEELTELGGLRLGDDIRGFFGNRKNRIRTLIFVLFLALIGAGTGAYMFYSARSNEEVYVSSIASITGASENGMINRFPGIVESRETWSAKLDTSKEIKEFRVSVGADVKKGDELLVYDTTEIEESLDEANLEIKRLEDDIAAIDDDIHELNTEKSEGGDSSELTVEIQQQESDKRSKNNEIESKKKEVEKLQKQIDEATVKSGIDGVVKSEYDENAEVVSSDAVTVVNTKNFQVKAKVNEQNLTDISQDMAVIVFSRVDDAIFWKGTINKIDTESPLANSGTMGVSEEESMEGDGLNATSSYAFYVTLENYEGLNMGQHVYVEPDLGQQNGEESDVIKLDSFMIDQSDTEHPFVWKANDKNRLRKQEVELGAYDELEDRYEVIKGLALSDKIAQPDDTLREGMKCIEMSRDDEDSGEDDETEDLDGEISEEEEGAAEDAADETGTDETQADPNADASEGAETAPAQDNTTQTTDGVQFGPQSEDGTGTVESAEDGT